jgi:hypothetical protein
VENGTEVSSQTPGIWRKPMRLMTMIVSGLLLVACGGGGGGGDGPAPVANPPTADQSAQAVWDQGNWDEVNWQ